MKSKKKLSRTDWWRMGLRLSLVGVLSVTLALGSILATPSPVQAAERRVCSSCTYTSIQAAINAAGSGDIIKVAQGTYYEKLSIQDKFVTLQGGYSPPNWTTPSTDPSLTVINAAGQNDSAIRIAWVLASGTVIENFTITGGTGHYYPGLQTFGGGIEVGQATATIRNNIIQGNSADDGGGIFITDLGHGPPHSQILNNVITGNIATRAPRNIGWGGGISLSDTSATIKDNEITNNRAYWGGGILMWHSNPTIEGNIISNNIAEGSYSDSVGGAFFIEEAVPIIRNNVIANNQAWRRADGIYIKRLDPTHPGQAQIVNNTIVNNKYDGSDRHEGICIREYISPIVHNNIIALNGCGIRAFDATVSPVLSNNDVWGNIVNYASLSPGPGDISADPLISGDYHLQAGSPCIDTGTSSNAPTTDFEGDPRPVDGDGIGGAQYDIGADEYALWITKQASPSSADPGDTITYVITYRNNDSNPVAGAVISDILSADLVPIDFNDSGTNSINQRLGTFYVWDVAGNLGSGDGGTITITARIDPGIDTPKSILNNAYFYAPGIGSFSDDAPIIVGGLKTYLPLILKND